MMHFDPSSRGPLKTGVRPGLVRQTNAPLPGIPTVAQRPAQASANAITASKHERSFRKGSLIFIEGESGEEMFILKTGRIKVLKQEGSKTLELATLGAGSVLGEMSLLIDMPRSATAQVVEDTSVIAINRTILEDTYTKIPPWFVTVIKLVVGRLRDTLRRNSDNLVRDHIGGVAQILLLLRTEGEQGAGGVISVGFDRLKEEVLNVIGLSGADTDRIVTELILKELLLLRRGAKGREFVDILKPDILQLYFEYRFGKSNGRPLPGEALSEKGTQLLKLLLSAGREKGVRQKDGTITLSRNVAEVEADRAGLGHHLDLDAVDELVNLKLIELLEQSSATQHLVNKQWTFRLPEKKLEKALLVREWMGAFADAD